MMFTINIYIKWQFTNLATQRNILTFFEASKNASNILEIIITSTTMTTINFYSFSLFSLTFISLFF